MKNFERESIMKKLISIVLILTMAIQYLSPLTVLAEDKDSIEDKIQFDVKWSSEEDVVEGTTDDSFRFSYDITFNKVLTGFQDVKLEITTDTVENSYDTIKYNGSNVGGNGYAVIYLGNQNTGVSLNGECSVKFGNTEEKLNRKVYVKIIGEYKDPETGEVRKIEKDDGSPYVKELDATITPANQIVSFSSNVNWQSAGNELKEPIYKSDKTAIMEKGRYVGHYVTEMTATYPIKIVSGVYSQKLELKITLNRYDNKGENKLEEGYTVDWDGLDKVLGEPIKTANEDGSDTYTFIKGTDTETFVEADTFKVNKTFNIAVKYTTLNTDPRQTENEVQSYTNVSFKAELDSIGFKKIKEYSKEERIEKVQYKSAINKTDIKGLNLYTPGTHAWINLNYYPKNSVIYKSTIEEFKKNRTMELTTVQNLTLINGDTSTVEAVLNYYTPIIWYMDANERVTYKSLTNEQIKLTSIQTIGEEHDSYLEIENDSIKLEENYIIEDKNTNEFSIKIKDSLRKYPNSISMTYTLDADKLNMTDEEIDKIIEFSFSMNAPVQWVNGNGMADFIVQTGTLREYSYMELKTREGFDSSVSKKNIPEERTITLKMYRNPTLFYEDHDSIVNKNPVFFVKLPSNFKYKDIDIKMSKNMKDLYIDEDNIDIIKVNGEQCLVIPCIGTYYASMNEVDINITLTRTLVNPVRDTYKLEAFMITDNENYVAKNNDSIVANSYGLKNGEKTSETIFKDSIDFSIVGESVLSSSTKIEYYNVLYQPDNSNEETEKGEKELPVLVDSNDTVIYRSQIESIDETLNNISILARLPVANNTNIYDSKQLIESDYKLPDEFYEKYGNNIKGNEKGNSIKQANLKDLKIIGVYKNDDEIKVNSSNYKIYYSKEANVDFDSESFEEYNEGDDLSQAKNIKVVFSENYELKSSESLILKYEMSMPDEECMVGATSATKYTRVSDSRTNTLYSPSIYVINANRKGKIILQKKFEDLPIGIAPNGESIEGIEFKLQYYDETIRERVFVKNDDGEDLKATTNAEGIATFENVPVRRILYI